MEELREEHRLYRNLDPVIFVSEDGELDFQDVGVGLSRVRVVSCFGPEFPLNFFIQNGLTVINRQ